MLPCYSYGTMRRRTPTSGSTCALGCTAALLLLLVSFACFSFRREMLASHLREGEYKASVSNIESTLQHQRTMYTRLESTFQATKRALVETQQSLTAAKTHAGEKDGLVDTIDELEDKLVYETQISSLLRGKISDLEEHYKTREADWHELALSWATYETDNIAEHQRLTDVLAECLHRPVTGEAHVAPLTEEPQIRDESRMEFDVALPEYFAAHQKKLLEHEEHHQQIRQQQQQQQAPTGNYNGDAYPGTEYVAGHNGRHQGAPRGANGGDYSEGSFRQGQRERAAGGRQQQYHARST